MSLRLLAVRVAVEVMFGTRVKLTRVIVSLAVVDLFQDSE
jgi:hypothetical protein